VTVSLATGQASGGDAEGDILVSIENLSGSDSADVLSGNAGGNTLSGADGNDILAGDAGNDVLRGGAGADHLDGGAGIDAVLYSEGSVGVTIDLAAGTATGGNARATP